MNRYNRFKKSQYSVIGRIVIWAFILGMTFYFFALFINVLQGE